MGEIKEEEKAEEITQQPVAPSQLPFPKTKKYHSVQKKPSKILEKNNLPDYPQMSLPLLSQDKINEIKEIKSLLEKNKEDLELTAKCYTLLDAETLEVLMSYRGKKISEIASLTKIMTCFIVCELIQRGKLDRGLMLKVSRKATQMIGTSAGLRYGDMLSLIDLLHGLMLPSGNDAALEIAIFIGNYLTE